MCYIRVQHYRSGLDRIGDSECRIPESVHGQEFTDRLVCGFSRAECACLSFSKASTRPPFSVLSIDLHDVRHLHHLANQYISIGSGSQALGGNHE